MSILSFTIAILGLALLMIIHESGHYFVARYFGMRVIRFSIGFGPVLYKKQPKGSPTTYQIAIVPFLAYVQIAGMNPFEEIDPKDKGSYANASLHGRILTIFAGPLANYLSASILFFIAFMVGGEGKASTNVEVLPDGAAAAADMKSGDKIIEIEGERVDKWGQIRDHIIARPNKKTNVVVLRDGKRISLDVTPEPKGENGQGLIGVKSKNINVPVSAGRATLLSIKQPARIVYQLVVGIGEMIARKVKPELSGPVGIVNEMAKAAEKGFSYYVGLLGALSAYLAGFNLLPIPALDGGRLLFLGYEAATRKRPNARVEAHIHAVGLILLLSVVAAVTIFSDLGRLGD
ncbi:MAG: membrane-associated zinc metalloprotease [Sorangium cellulosum]|nr:MAG: membrane-associated zinc metalloprotease [Sorangium cellulosum]